MRYVIISAMLSILILLIAILSGYYMFALIWMGYILLSSVMGWLIVRLIKLTYPEL